MPIINTQDAREVDTKIDDIFDAPSTEARRERIRELFVEILDFHGEFFSSIDLSRARNNVTLPDEAHLVAQLEEVQVVYVDMAASQIESDRVNKREAQEAARLIESELGSDLFLVFTNRNSKQLHFIYPSFEGRQPSLRRMVVEKCLPRRTLVQQISNIWTRWNQSGNIGAELDRAFDVEAVTKDFFEEYKKVFDAAKEKITGFGDDPEEQDRKNLFVQTLFNRLMFVYFISRKGWLEFRDDKDYLNALWKDYVSSNAEDNFYASRLSPLFFEGLNNPFNRQVTSIDPNLRASIGSVPFLNGGLFDKTLPDQRDDIMVPDDAIQPILTQLFDAFNFTVMESTPFDVEVAVDPEMLGKVFEELVTGRHESGSYYTPRPVVSFMCREALKGYLNTHVGAADEETIAKFVDERSTSGIRINAAQQIATALETVKVVDPACGSGAYLLGMMQELVDLQTTLFNVPGMNSESLYDLKLQIIRDNLYGIDIDQFAVNTTMLRLWLSLAIDYEGPWPEPLPNLEFKVVCGDSLLGPDPSPENLGDLSSHWIRELNLVRLKSDYMNAHLPEEKMDLKGRIDSALERVRSAFQDAALSDNVVDWRVDFAEVFVGSGGFDIVVANPPYGITIDNERSLTISNKDSYTNFMAMVADIAPVGIMAFITPTSWETGDRFEKFRRVMFKQMSLTCLVNLPYDVFEAPNVDTAVTICHFGQSSSNGYNLVTFEKRADLAFDRAQLHSEFVDWDLVTVDSRLRLPLSTESARILRRISPKATPLGEMTESRRGIPVYKFAKHAKPYPNTLPVFDGQVYRYSVKQRISSEFLELSSVLMKFHRGERILARRLVARNNRLSFARVKEDFAVKESILPFLPKFEDSKTLAMLLGVLNSSLMSYLYLTRSTAANKDDFRQVTLTDLRELPILFPDADGTRRLLANTVVAREIGGECAGRLEAKIDQIVYETYGVDLDERRVVEAWLDRPA